MNCTRPYYQILGAVLAILLAASPPAFASDPARLDKVGELSGQSRRFIRARIRWILANGLSEEKKRSLVGQYLRRGRSEADIEILIGRPNKRENCDGIVVARHEDLTLVFDLEGLAAISYSRTDWLVLSRSIP